MSSSQDLVQIIKKELKAQRKTYADLAIALDMAESSVKRMLAKGCYSLDVIAELTDLSLADVEKLKKEQAEQA